MVRTLVLLTLAVLGMLLLCTHAAAEKPPSLIVPDLPTADMRLSWQDFRELLLLIQSPEAEKAEPEDALKRQPPPVRWTLFHAEYDVDAREGGSAVVQAVLSFQVWQQGWVTLPLFDSEAGIESILVNGAAAPLIADGERYAVLIDKPGEYRIEAVFSVRTTESDGVVSLEYAVPEAGQTRVKLVIAESKAEITAPGATRIYTALTEGGVTATLIFRRTESISATWRLPAKEKPPEIAPKPVDPPRFSVLSSVLATATETHLACDATFQMDMLRGKVNGFTLNLPAAVQVLEVTGKGITWKADPQGDTQVLDVRLNFDVDQNYALSMRYELPIAEGAAAVAVPRIDVAGAARHRGYIAVTTQGNVEVDQAGEAEGLRRVDTADLPTELRSRSPQPILHAFQFTGDAYLLALDYKRLQDVPVRIAGIDRGRVVSVITQEGLVITHAQYLVRNNLKKFIRVRIGAGAEVWGARVNGKPVRPARDGEEAAAGAVLVPLIKSQEAGKELGAFPVELVYMHRIDPLDMGRNRRSLHAPETDILANFVDWVVLVPEGHRIYSTPGDLQRVDGLRPFATAGTGGLGGHYAIQGGALHIPGEGQRETIYRLREGIERFLITSINDPASSTRAQGGAGRYDGAQRDALPDVPSVPSAATTTAGVLPIDFVMPVAGHPVFFERVVVPMNTAMQITVEMLYLPALTRLKPLLYLLALLIGFVAARAGWTFATHGRAWVWVLLGLLLLAPLAAGVWWLQPDLAGIYRCGILGALAVIAWRLPALVRHFRGGETSHA